MKKKAMALALATLMGTSTILNGAPITVFAQDNTAMETNTGDTTFPNVRSDVRFYDILPEEGGENIYFTELENVEGATVYYTIKPVSQLPKFDANLNLRDWDNQKLNDLGFTKTAPTDLSTVTAIYIDFGNKYISLETYVKVLSLLAHISTPVGYDFVHWEDERGGTYDESNVAQFIRDNPTFSLKEIFREKKVNVIYNENFGDSPKETTKEYSFGDTIQLSDVAIPTRAGYTFKGWSESNVATSPDFLENSKIDFVNTKTVYAIWEANDYAIKFDANGGTGTMPDQAMKYDQAENLTKNAYTKEGYTFKGWATTPDGNIVYADEVEVKNLTNKANESIALYAVWEINSYDVTFDSQGGSSVDGQNVEYNALVEKPTNPTREGYTFGGWYKEAECTTVWDFDTDKMPASNLTLYAKWILNASELNHAPTINAKDKVLTVGDTFNPLDGVTAHDTEDGDITLTEANIVANNVDMSKAGTYSITYKVTDSKGASTVKTITVTVNEKATIPVEKPDNTTTSKADKLPQTGDVSNLGLLGLMFAGSGGMLLGLNRKNRKKRKK